VNNFDVSVPDWNSIPPLSITSIAEIGTYEVVFQTTEGALVVSLHEFGMRLRFGKPTFSDYGMLVEPPRPERLTLSQTDERTVINAAEHCLIVQHQPFSFEFFYQDRLVQRSPSDGHFVRDSRLPSVARISEGWFFALELDASEPVYGLGEKWGRLDKRGQYIRSYNHDALGVNAEISYKNTPFAWSPSGWGVFVHTPAPVSHGVGFAPWSQRSYGILVEEDSADIFIFSSSSGAKILTSYADLTGHAPVPPPWSLGVILSKAYYRDADELMATAKAIREKQMPCDVITLDGRAWQDTDTRFAFEWDSSRYPNPKEIIDQLKSMNFKVCVWEYPLVSVNNPLFDVMSKKGWLLTRKGSNETYRYQWDTSCFGEVLTPLPDSGIVDFTHPDAYAFWRDSHKPLFDLGVDMIKADFGEQIEADMQASNGDVGDTLHNVYSMIYNRCVYEAADRYCHSGAFLFSRSSWTGSQRYPSQWGGDPQADWGGLSGSLRGGLSWGLSGAPFYATDVGGFYGDKRDPELYVRWVQMAVFCAHMRLHGIGQREPWSYGREAENAANKALALRYRLLPYIYRVMEQASDTGLPVQRAMALACPLERASWGFEEQFFFGDDVLVAPCVRRGGKVEFYLPKSFGDFWRKFPSGQRFEGGTSHTLTLDLDDHAVFVPEGRSIPLGPDAQYVPNISGHIEPVSQWVSE